MKHRAKLPAAGMYRLDLPEQAVQAIVEIVDRAGVHAVAAPVLHLIRSQVQEQDMQRAADAAAAQRRQIEAELEPAVRERLRAEIRAELEAERISPI